MLFRSAGLLGALTPIIALGALAYGLYKLIKSDKGEMVAPNEFGNVQGGMTPDMSSAIGYGETAATTDDEVRKARENMRKSDDPAVRAAALELDKKDAEKALSSPTQTPPSTSPTSTSPTPISSNLLEMIGKAEGGKIGYDAINRGKAGDTPNGMPGLSNMTVGDVMKLQKDKKVFAAGKYQIIPTTLEGLIKDGVAKKEDIFNAETQDKLAKELINRRLAKAGNDPMKQQLELSKEFASIANPYTGSSYYDGKGNNKASIASIFPGTPGSAIAASSTAVADGRMASSSQPVVINSPQTVNNVSQGGGGGLAAASSVFDTEFGKLLIERSVG